MMHPRRQSGVTLIEVLITVLVMAIGLLGMAALQLNGLNTNHDAYYRSQATLFAADLADRMRANLDAARDGRYAGSTPGDDPGFDCETSFPTGDQCTAEELASADLYNWLQRLQDATDGLPVASATVVCADACGVGFPYTITLAWDEDRSGETDGDDPSLSVQVVP